MGIRLGRTASALIRPLRYCWKPLAWFWVTILIGVGINVGSSWLTAQHWMVSGTPLGWIMGHSEITLPLAGALLVLTGLARLASVRAAKQTDDHAALHAHPSPALAQQNRER